MTAQIQPRECRHCRHSEGIFTPMYECIVICLLTAKVDPTPCKDFEREPGSDDE